MQIYHGFNPKTASNIAKKIPLIKQAPKVLKAAEITKKIKDETNYV